MKKIISCLLLLTMTGFSLLVAQNQKAKPNAPSAVRQCFQKDYPGAAAVRWENLGHNWWYGAYNSNGQILGKSCNIDGDGAVVATLVKENSIPKDIADKIAEKYGPKIYDITRVRGASGRDQYIIRTLQDGKMKRTAADI
jgi:hypothetical protein